MSAWLNCGACQRTYGGGRQSDSTASIARRDGGVGGVESRTRIGVFSRDRDASRPAQPVRAAASHPQRACTSRITVWQPVRRGAARGVVSIDQGDEIRATITSELP
jgi:hypothetical protein